MILFGDSISIFKKQTQVSVSILKKKKTEFIIVVRLR
jgi:translation initiation factor IF-2